MTTAIEPVTKKVKPVPVPPTLDELIERLGGIPLARILAEPAPGTATEKDLVAAERCYGRLYELVDGVLVEKTIGIRESILASALCRILGNFVVARNLGIVTGPDGSIRLFPGLIRVPDVAFISWARLPGRKIPSVAIRAWLPILPLKYSVRRIGRARSRASAGSISIPGCGWCGRLTQAIEGLRPCPEQKSRGARLVRSPGRRSGLAWVSPGFERAVRRTGSARLTRRRVIGELRIMTRNMRMSDSDRLCGCPGPRPFWSRSRREFLKVAGNGFGMLGLADLLARDGIAGQPASPLAPRPGHFPAKAKRCIFLFMTGGPSQMDLFDPKPLLNRLDGQPLPPSFGKIHSQFLESDPLCLGSRRTWGKFGQSGMDMSDLVPHLHAHADDIALVHSCVADSVVHAPAMYQMNTGRVLMGFPSLGSWVTYGLGSESEDLPSFVVMSQPEGTPEGGAPCWGAGFLPAHYQGTLFRSGPAPIVNLKPPAGLAPGRQRRLLDLLRAMNEDELEPGDTELSARIATYELAYRMQSAAPEAVDLSRESAATKAMYGLDQERTAEFGTRCLLARRLVERGVRFVQLYSGGGPVAVQWDAHDNLDANHEKMCGMTDQPVAALLTDLKRTGLLDETLVVWGGEFGRTPVRQGGGRGRDHNATGFTMWMAGGGVKGGTVVGATDEAGLNAVEDRAHINDIHATILHLMGINHKQLTFLHSGRDERLTDVGGRVLKKLLA